MREMVNARNENFAKIGFLLQTKHRGQESKLLAQLPHDQVIVISISISIFLQYMPWATNFSRFWLTNRHV